MKMILISIIIQKNSTEKSHGKVQPSSKMGYITTVEEARKQLEDLYKLKDNKEKLKLFLQT